MHFAPWGDPSGVWVWVWQLCRAEAPSFKDLRDHLSAVLDELFRGNQAEPASWLPNWLPRILLVSAGALTLLVPSRAREDDADPLPLSTFSASETAAPFALSASGGGSWRFGSGALSGGWNTMGSFILGGGSSSFSCRLQTDARWFTEFRLMLAGASVPPGGRSVGIS
mmetsp:Transcript_55864/g.158631  ORF Transcript_55864/g.158631 Transcript_55864/m.158631 type:complete len:168 (+) Transcript_55864:454-957(+)